MGGAEGCALLIQQRRYQEEGDAIAAKMPASVEPWRELGGKPIKSLSLLSHCFFFLCLFLLGAESVHIQFYRIVLGCFVPVYYLKLK